MKIFCVEDDDNIRSMTLYALESQGYDANGFENAESFFAAMNNPPDLILLDVMLPDTDGFEILKALKASKNRDIPVIFLTAKTSEMDKVKGLDMGADDYITKPFGVMELLSRVRAVMRRSMKSENSEEIGGITIDTQRRTVKADGEEIVLTYKEFELLSYLFKNNGIVISRDRLLSEIWGYDFEGETRTVDVHIRTLRQKMGKYADIIETVRNVGYKVRSEKGEEKN